MTQMQELSSLFPTYTETRWLNEQKLPFIYLIFNGLEIASL